jgi:hypothetical protein
MKLREQRKLRLDDPVGQYVKGLHPQVAQTTIAQLLSPEGAVGVGVGSGVFVGVGDAPPWAPGPVEHAPATSAIAKIAANLFTLHPPLLDLFCEVGSH